jgi:4-oxalocrotonate tautomerase
MAMPMIHVELFEGRTMEQKREFVETLTRETCRILKCEPAAVDIIFQDIKKSNWAHAGKLASES